MDTFRGGIHAHPVQGVHHRRGGIQSAAVAAYRCIDNWPRPAVLFGRGRVLGCLFGEYITKKNIREATAFLSGACSCEVKELNPGVDLLVAAPWDMVVMNSFVEDTPLPELTGVMPEPDEAAGTGDTSPEVDINPEDNSSLFTIYAVSLSGVILIVGILGFVISRRRGE